MSEQITYKYQARVISVHCESDDCDGVTNTTVDATFDVKIEALNCSNEEFAKHFFNVFGIGQLEQFNTLALYFDRVDVKPNEIITISSSTSFQAMLDRRIQDANQELNQILLKFLSDKQLPPYSEIDLVETESELADEVSCEIHLLLKSWREQRQ